MGLEFEVLKFVRAVPNIAEFKDKAGSKAAH